MSRPVLHVVAGVVQDTDGKILIAQRPAGKHMAGSWEFPGGKLEPGEHPESGLRRELREELGVDPICSRPLIRYTHSYADRDIDLDVRIVTEFTGVPSGLEGQALDWVMPDELLQHGLLPADRPIVSALLLSPLCAISRVDAESDEQPHWVLAALREGAGLIQLRSPGQPHAWLEALTRQLAPLCHDAGAKLVVNGDPRSPGFMPTDWGADGFHAPARVLAGMTTKPDGGLFGASCHDEKELRLAERLGADYAFLSPVRTTASHPRATPLGWDRFGKLIADCRMPVYALGGMQRDDVECAWRHGAQGIAAISAFPGP